MNIFGFDEASIGSYFWEANEFWMILWFEDLRLENLPYIYIAHSGSGCNIHTALITGF